MFRDFISKAETYCDPCDPCGRIKITARITRIAREKTCMVILSAYPVSRTGGNEKMLRNILQYKRFLW